MDTEWLNVEETTKYLDITQAISIRLLNKAEYQAIE